MYKELATIKDEDKVTGFLMYDGKSTSIMDVEEAKIQAAKGNIDTLGYENGHFVPILQGDIEKELKKKFMLGKHKKITAEMTFEEFVDLDCMFRQQDMDLMKDNHTVVMANICNIFRFGNAGINGWVLTAAFYSPDTEIMDRIRRQMVSYGKTVKLVKDYDGFFMAVIPLSDLKTGFDLLTFQETLGLNFIYNLDTVKLMGKRTDFAMKCMLPGSRLLMKMMKPEEKDFNIIAGVLREANCMSIRNLSKNEESGNINGN